MSSLGMILKTLSIVFICAASYCFTALYLNMGWASEIYSGSLDQPGLNRFGIDLPFQPEVPSQDETPPLLPPRPEVGSGQTGVGTGAGGRPGSGHTGVDIGSGGRPGSGNPGTGAPLRPPTRPVINPVETAWPQENCRTLDQGNYGQLMRAAENLRRAIPSHPSCEQSPQLPASQAIQASTQQLGQAIQGIINTLARYSPDSNLSPEELEQFLKRLAETPPDLRAFSTQVATINAELLSLSRSFQSAGFLNSDCGRSYTQAGFILNLTEVASSLTPLFSAAARFFPELNLATPVMLGLSALGSGSALIRQVHNQNTLDMTNANARRALLINVCEYTKVARRLKLIQSVEAGAIEDVQQLSESLATAELRILEGHFAPSQIRRAKQLGQISKSLYTLRRHANWGLLESQSILQRVREPITGFNSCRSLLSRWKSAGLPVFQWAQALLDTSSQANEERPWTSIDIVGVRDIWLIDYASAQAKILVLPLDKGSQTQAFCQQDLVELLSLTSQVFSLVDEPLIRRLREVSQELSEQPALRNISMIRKSFLDEIQTLGQIESIFRSLTQNGHSIARSEIEIEFNYSRLGLFGSRDSSFCIFGHCIGLGGYSPAMAWLDFYWGHFQRNRDAFIGTYRSLIEEAYGLTRAGRHDFIQRDAQGNALKDPTGRDLEMSLVQKQAQIADDWARAQRLEPLTASNITRGSAFHKQICGRLQRSWGHWASMVDQLAAQILFCDEISPWVHPGLDNRLAQHCFDEFNSNQKLVRSSTVRSTRETLVSRGLFAQAQQVRAAEQALRCTP